MALGADPRSSAPPSGREILFEHVHFDWNGNFLLGRMMAQGAAAALFGGRPDDLGWLDSDASAAALAYTPHERLPMLLRIDVLVRKPPFTEQLTYCEDEARMAREIEAAGRTATLPGTLSHAAEVATTALARDPDNPALAGILEGIDLDVRAHGGALGLARRAGRLPRRPRAGRPMSPLILMRLEPVSRGGGRSSCRRPIPVPTSTSLAPVFRGLLDPDHGSSRPGSSSLDRARWPGGRAMRGSASSARAWAPRRATPAASGNIERSRRIPRTTPRSRPWSRPPRLAEPAPDAAQATLAATDAQPRNESNNLQAAGICEARGDAGLARFSFLAAAEPERADVRLVRAERSP